MSPDLSRCDTTRINTRSEILENTKSSLPAYQATCFGHHRRQSWHAIELSVNPTRLNGRDRRWLAHAALVRHLTGNAVVGRPTSTNGGVIQYGFWKVVQFLKHVSKKVEINPKDGDNTQLPRHGTWPAVRGELQSSKGQCDKAVAMLLDLAIMLDSAIKLNLLVRANERRAVWLNPIDPCDKAPNSNM